MTMQKTIDSYVEMIDKLGSSGFGDKYRSLLEGYQKAIEEVLELETENPVDCRMTGVMRSKLEKLNFGENGK
jgi:hypothetical protein